MQHLVVVVKFIADRRLAWRDDENIGCCSPPTKGACCIAMRCSLRTHSTWCVLN